MAWPDDRDLPIEVHAAFGADLTADPGVWSWTDLSSRLRAEPIRLRAGKSGGAAHVSPGTCTVTLVNDDGALTPLHPMSPYWPDVELGTPLRVSLRRVEDAFARTLSAGWGDTDTGETWEGYGAGGTTSGSDFPVSGGKARHSVPVAAAYRTSWLPALKVRDCRVHVSGVSLPFSDVTGGSVEPGNILLRAQDWGSYYLARVEVTTGEAVLCKLYAPGGGLLASATVAGLTHTAAQTLEVVAEITGSRLSMKVWATGGVEPAGWAVTASDHGLSLPGGVGVRTGVAGGNTNTKPVVASYEAITVWVDRFSGYADQWDPTYVPTGEVDSDGRAEMASAVRVTCSGILRRLQQGTPPVRSPLRRTIPATGALAYWPVEDGTDASVAGSAIPGHPPITISGTVEFAPIEEWADARGYEVRYGTEALVDVAAGATLSAAVPSDVTTATATGAGWTVALAADVGSPSSLSADLVLVEVHTPGGTYTTWRMVLTKTGRTQIIASNASSTVTVVDEAVMFGEMVPHNMAVWQVAGDVFAGFSWSSVGGWEGLGWVVGTVGGVSQVTVNPTGVTSTAAVPLGHIALWAGHELPVVNLRDGDMMLALFGYLWTGIATGASGPHGEPATARLARLAGEDGVPLDVPTVTDGDTDRMGWQRPGTALDLYRSCEAVDLGILAEQGYGLVYVPRAHRYNPPVALTIDLAEYRLTRGSGDPLAPTYDDQNVRNQWTVARTNGSSATAADVAHQRRGVYSDSVELDLAGDGRLPDHASWRVHLGTVVDLREPTFPIDLAANPDLLDGWLSCRVGSRIVRTNPPSQHRPGDLDRLVEGWTETIGPRSWQVQVVPSPAEPWEVATADGDQRVPADGSTLAASLSDSATSLVLASTVGNGAWTQDPAYFPLDVRVGGERVTVSAIGNPPRLNENALFESTVAPWSSPDATITRSTTQAHEGVASLLLTPSGAASMARAESESVTVTAGRVYTGFMWVRCSVARAVDIYLAWFTSGGAFIDSGFATTDVAAATWTAVSVSAAAPPTAGLARFGLRLTGTPPNTHTTWIDEAFLSDAHQQTVTLSARGVNGVQRAWPAGTEVDVWEPAVAPL